MVQYGLKRVGVWHGMVRCGMVWGPGGVWHGTVQCGLGGVAFGRGGGGFGVRPQPFEYMLALALPVRGIVRVSFRQQYRPPPQPTS